MRKTIKNIDIDKILTTINSNASFQGKIPYAIRHALRVNKEILADRMRIFADERFEILQNAVKDGKAKQEGDQIIIDEMYKNDVVKDIIELSQATNELEFEMIDNEILENYLRANELSMAEEDVLLFFRN